MLAFIPLNKTATVYGRGTNDAWGRPAQTATPIFTGRCQINYNSDLTTVSGLDGEITTVNASVVFHGFVPVKVGDFVEFTDQTGVTGRYPVEDVSFMEDWGKKIVATRVVTGNAKGA